MGAGGEIRGIYTLPAHVVLAAIETNVFSLFLYIIQAISYQKLKISKFRHLPVKLHYSVRACMSIFIKSRLEGISVNGISYPKESCDEFTLPPLAA